jgi:hypothetical protein
MSKEFHELPQRKSYSGGAEIARGFPFVENQQSIQDALVQGVNSTWLIPKNATDVLNETQKQIQKILDEK